MKIINIKYASPKNNPNKTEPTVNKTKNILFDIWNFAATNEKTTTKTKTKSAWFPINKSTNIF